MPLRLTPDPAPTPAFGSSTPFRLGVEEELFLVDPATHEIAHCTDAVLARGRRFLRGGITGEMCDGVVELVTPVCESAPQAVRRLRALRAAVRVAGAGGPALLGAGLHPTAAFGSTRYRRGEHYDAVAQDTRGSLAQSAYCGVHVHVGMPDAETAIAAFNGMRKWVPLLQALSANSPFWHGEDSGYCSARAVRCRSVPRTGLPRAFADWEDWSTTMARVVQGAGIPDERSLWWDLRPHPTLGTLEVRVLDAQSSLLDLEGLVALVHCLVLHEALTADPAHPPKEVLDEACHQASRDGLDARLCVDGPPRHVQDVARHALELAGGYAHRLGCGSSLRQVERMLSEGNGAVRARRAFAAGGMRAVTAGLVAETRGDAAVDRALSAAS